MVYEFFDKKSSGSGITNESNYQLADELHKSIIRKFKKRKVYSSFRDNAFQKIISDGRKPNKIWADQGSEFYNNSFKNFLKINSIEMYSKYNEGKSAVAERFIRTLTSKIFKHMTAISKNVYFDVLDNIVNKFNNTNHRTIKIKHIEVSSNSYAEYNENSDKKDPKFKVGDRVTI